MQEGTYEIQVIVKDGFSASKSESTSATYTAQTRVVGTSAVVSPMANPLVALYSAPPSPGASMYVQFAQEGSTLSWQNTSPLPIVPGESTNFIVAGMLPDTTYLMRHVLDDGTVSAPLAFTTGSLPANLNFPTFTVVQPPAAGTDLSQGVIFHAGVTQDSNTVDTVATDLNGNVIWYYDPVANNFPGYSQNLEPGGTVMMLGGTAVGVVAGYRHVAAGRPGRRHAARDEHLCCQRPARRDGPAADHRLRPRGQALAQRRHGRHRQHAEDRQLQGKAHQVHRQHGDRPGSELPGVMGLESFKWLNTNRLGNDFGAPVDWLHANSVSWSPEDDDLVVSLRTQDWAIKIDYANGTGNGHIVWKLGPGGNFKAISNIPEPVVHPPARRALHQRQHHPGLR